MDQRVAVTAGPSCIGPAIGNRFAATGGKVHIIDMNLTGTFMVTAATISHLIKADAASIVFISSLASRFDYFHRSAYPTPKWGVIGLAKTLAMELGPVGVTSNTILPGAIAEGQLEAVSARRADANSSIVTQERNQAFSIQSVQRFAQADEIADLTFFLAGPSA